MTTTPGPWPSTRHHGVRISARLRPSIRAGTRERGRVGVLAELAAGLHAGEAFAEVGFPALEAGGDRCPRLRVVLGELAGEGADRAPTACLPVDLQLDERVEPAFDSGPGVEPPEQVTLDVQHCVRGDVDDGVHEVVAVVEVVIELAAACARPGSDVVEAHPGGALFGHELRRRLKDALPCRAAPFCGRCLRHKKEFSRFGLDSPLAAWSSYA